MRPQPFFLALLLLTSLSLLQQVKAQPNTKYGTEALFSNKTGYGNIAFGAYALHDNTTGFRNSALGAEALHKNTTGTYNTATGFEALHYNTTGAGNTATGTQALFSNTTGYENTATGMYALYYNTTGAYNTAMGSGALINNTTGNYNTAIGRNALYLNSTGFGNTATGMYALYDNHSGRDNTANGTDALHFNRTGDNNTATGVRALYNNTSGRNNVAVGLLALYNTTTGFNNTAMGNYALQSNTAGSNNTAVGDSAGARYSYNFSTFVGYKTTTSVAGLSNVTVIGNAAFATASNQVRIGNTSVTSIGGKVGWSTLSDGRYKKNVQEDVPGIVFINKLRPVTYTIDEESLDRALNGTTAQGSSGAAIGNAKEKHTGFVAQEVEQAAKELNYDFSGVDAPKNDKDLYGLRYSEFVVPLVKAVQELSKENEELKEENQEIRAEVAELKQMVNRLANGQSIDSTLLPSSAYLEQNTPNPSTGTTTIRYHLPSNTTAAQLVLTNMKGQTLKTYSLSNRGTGQVTISSGTLPSGTYTYTLYVQGKQVDSKQLVLTR